MIWRRLRSVLWALCADFSGEGKRRRNKVWRDLRFTNPHLSRRLCAFSKIFTCWARYFFCKLKVYRKIGNKRESPRDHLYIDVKFITPDCIKWKLMRAYLTALRDTESYSWCFERWLFLPRRRSREFSCNSFFWDYSGMRIHGIGGNCVLLGPILIPEWTA